jgi:hypothetical protein
MRGSVRPLVGSLLTGLGRVKTVTSHALRRREVAAAILRRLWQIGVNHRVLGRTWVEALPEPAAETDEATNGSSDERGPEAS